ncbi:major facilitator superfamily domain-containing protein [Paraphoma chrysanthemicola]|uniref:Major facilitator superfamily domain-containing protein n=1 Tax=Paraphoma chrysanthemicola TaxID=798071 RepID=A0A8K0VTU6_9PLEO|nr:major facilitator superfamily domain-containing protein [Paraphoma chrysanthemicola]
MPSNHRRSLSEPTPELDPRASSDEHADGYHWHHSTNSGGPKEWTDKKKWTHVLLVAALTMATPLGSTIHAPALAQIADAFAVQRSTASLTVQTYVLGFSIAPLLFLPLSKIYGRLPIYNFANVAFLLGHAGCAIASNFPLLLICRFLAGCGGACAITQGSGTIADIIQKEKRGRAVALMAFGTVWAPTLGPVIGGRVAEAYGWRGCFWVLVCIAACNAVITFIVMDETSTSHTTHSYQALPLEELRSPLMPTAVEDVDSKIQQYAKPATGLSRFALDVVLGPFRLMRHPLFSTIALLSALFYSIQIYLYVDVPATYRSEYSFTPSETGLAFMGIGVGMTVGLLAFGIFSDRIMIALAGNGERLPEHRLPLMLVSSVFVSAGLLVFSLTSRPSVHWIFPVLGNALTGAGLYTVSMGAALYLMDLCPARAADSATLLSVVRFPTGAIVSASGVRLVQLVGRSTMEIVFAVLAIQAVPIVFLLYRHGARISMKHRLT